MTQNIDLTLDEYYDHLEAQEKQKREKNMRTWSASSLRTYLDCRLKFYFAYIKGWRIDVPSPALSVGTSFHASAEFLNREQAMKRKVKKIDAFSAFDQTWDEESLSLQKYYNTYRIDADKKVGLNLVEKYFASGARKNMHPLLYQPPLVTDNSQWVPAVEMKIEIPFVSLKTGEELFKDSKYHIIGYIDVVAEGVKDNPHYSKQDLLIVDYKTTTHGWDQFSIDTNLQLLLYSYAIRYKLRFTPSFNYLGKDKEDAVGIIALTKGKVLKNGALKEGRVNSYFVKIQDEEIDFLEKLLLRVSQEVHEAKDDIKNYPPTPSSDNCRFCAFREPCLNYRRGASPEKLNEWFHGIKPGV